MVRKTLLFAACLAATSASALLLRPFLGFASPWDASTVLQFQSVVPRSFDHVEVGAPFLDLDNVLQGVAVQDAGGATSANTHVDSTVDANSTNGVGVTQEGASGSGGVQNVEINAGATTVVDNCINAMAVNRVQINQGGDGDTDLFTGNLFPFFDECEAAEASSVSSVPCAECASSASSAPPASSAPGTEGGPSGGGGGGASGGGGGGSPPVTENHGGGGGGSGPGGGGGGSPSVTPQVKEDVESGVSPSPEEEGQPEVETPIIPEEMPPSGVGDLPLVRLLLSVLAGIVSLMIVSRNRGMFRK